MLCRYVICLSKSKPSCLQSRFSSHSVNLQRQRPPVSLSTYAKIQERMLCFFGFVKNTAQLERPLTEDCFLRIPFIEAYVDFLRDEHNLSAATCANHLSSLQYPVKLLHREYGPDFKLLNGVGDPYSCSCSSAHLKAVILWADREKSRHTDVAKLIYHLQLWPK
ncbi:uncharacterized protein [Montipora capricornis]|uniref:uncharacterized protein n=1 Tax=Montipora capricornis TaxID=246305 RepID=UPI0035F1EB6E